MSSSSSSSTKCRRCSHIGLECVFPPDRPSPSSSYASRGLLSHQQHPYYDAATTDSAVSPKEVQQSNVFRYSCYCVHAFASKNPRVIRTYACTYACTCMYVCKHVCMYIGMHIDMYVCKQACVYVCMTEAPLVPRHGSTCSCEELDSIFVNAVCTMLCCMRLVLKNLERYGCD